MSKITTPVFWKLTDCKDKFFVFSQGGTRSSKTYSMMQLIYLTALKYQDEPFTFSVCSESLPHLKKGAMKDFFDFLKKYNLYNEKDHHRTDNKYFIKNFTVEFFGVDSSDKVHGASREFLFCNEIQNIRYETFFQLVQRTSRRVYADYNPTFEFWVFREFLNNPNFSDDIHFVKSTIFDNPYCPENIKRTVLARAATDENYKKVYVDGETGTVDGLIFPDFEIVEKIPDDIDNRFAGLDFGFVNDPTAFISMAANSKDLYLDELIYETGLLNSSIAKKIKDFGYKYDIFADSAEQKSIAEIKNDGVYNIKKAIKPKGSVIFGIKLLKEFNIKVTKRSVNVISELRKYCWIKEKNAENEYIDIPVDRDNHAIDAARYGAFMKLAKGNIQETFEF